MGRTLVREEASQSGCAALLTQCRELSLRLVHGLSDADATVQSMEDASPSKWHLAHTTWFFEEFVLARHVPGYRVFHGGYRYLFNSYYNAVGERHPRARRGMLTRPALDEVLAYRAHVDAALRGAWHELSPGALALIELGIQHEQQHQELLLTDLLHLLAQNPLKPAYRTTPEAVEKSGATPMQWVPYAGGQVSTGHDGRGFAFDCETPRHDVLLRPYALASRPVNQAQWLAFMEDGGYRSPQHWLSDGWALVERERWQAPLYWSRKDGGWRQMTLAGERELDLDAPVCHISYFEADAYARWAGKRLPTEFEWEAAARAQPVEGHFAGGGRMRPASTASDSQYPLKQLYGDVWEWTASPYTAYPGFRPAAGAVGEYNGKFMNGQYVLRGGSCATPAGHVRASYRNFFYPHQRWQFMGLRLARDLP
ncbi:MAG: ergothioneine biosynthesis protein EgtB [Burkholderiales bacterium]